MLPLLPLPSPSLLHDQQFYFFGDYYDPQTNVPYLINEADLPISTSYFATLSPTESAELVATLVPYHLAPAPHKPQETCHGGSHQDDEESETGDETPPQPIFFQSYHDVICRQIAPQNFHPQSQTYHLSQLSTTNTVLPNWHILHPHFHEVAIDFDLVIERNVFSVVQYNDEIRSGIFTFDANTTTYCYDFQTHQIHHLSVAEPSYYPGPFSVDPAMKSFRQYPPPYYRYDSGNTPLIQNFQEFYSNMAQNSQILSQLPTTDDENIVNCENTTESSPLCVANSIHTTMDPVCVDFRIPPNVNVSTTPPQYSSPFIPQAVIAQQPTQYTTETDHEHYDEEYNILHTKQQACSSSTVNLLEKESLVSLSTPSLSVLSGASGVMDDDEIVQNIIFSSRFDASSDVFMIEEEGDEDDESEETSREDFSHFGANIHHTTPPQQKHHIALIKKKKRQLTKLFSKSPNHTTIQSENDSIPIIDRPSIVNKSGHAITFNLTTQQHQQQLLQQKQGLSQNASANLSKRRRSNSHTVIAVNTLPNSLQNF